MLAEPRKIANGNDDIETLWQKTKKVIIEELGEDDEDLQEMDEQFESFEDDDEAEDFYEEMVVEFMDSIGPDNLEFGINNDDEVGYWHSEDISNGEDNENDEDEENAWERLREITDEDEETEMESDMPGPKSDSEGLEGKIEILDNDNNVIAKSEYHENPDKDIIRVCMKCKKILSGTSKKKVSELTPEEKDMVSHSICNACLEKYYPEGEDE